MTDRYTFFYEVTSRICGDLDLSRAALRVLRYLYGIMPAEEMLIALFDDKKQRYRTIVRSSLAESNLIDRSIPLSPQAWDFICSYDTSHAIKTVDAARDPVLQSILSSEEIASIARGGTAILPLDLESQFVGVVLFFCLSGKEFKENQLALLSSVAKPFGIALSNSLAYLALQEREKAIKSENETLRRRLSSQALASDSGMTLDEAVAHTIYEALEKSGGKISGKKGAAALLGVNPSTLRSRMKKLGIK